MERGCAQFSLASLRVFRILKTKKVDRAITATKKAMNTIHNKGPSTKESKSTASLLDQNPCHKKKLRLKNKQRSTLAVRAVHHPESQRGEYHTKPPSVVKSKVPLREGHSAINNSQLRRFTIDNPPIPYIE